MTPEAGLTIVGVFFTLAVFSYLLGDNPLFRFTLHLFVGVTAGYLAYAAYEMLLVPWMSQRLLSGSWQDRLLAVVPILCGMIVLSKHAGLYSVHFSRYARLALAFLIGVGCAVTLGGALSGTLLPQAWGLLQAIERETLLKEAQKGLIPLTEYAGSAVVIILGALATLLSFRYGSVFIGGQISGSRRAFAWISAIGRFFTAAALGVIFGGVYLAGLSALVERVQFIVRFLQGQAW